MWIYSPQGCPRKARGSHPKGLHPEGWSGAAPAPASITEPLRLEKFSEITESNL